MIKDENLAGQLAYVPSKYSKAYNHYSKTQIKLVMPFLTSISQTCEYGAQFPICKVLKAVSKFFLLNEIEVIFLAYVIRETNWDIRDKVICSHAESIQDIVCYVIQNLDYKRLILYLMIAAYTVKYYLNKDTSEEMEEATKRCPNFKAIFEKWAKKHSAITTKINPRTLNSVYKVLYHDLRKERKDFNLMVDSILQISPAYNPEKDKGGKKQQRKKIDYRGQKTSKSENAYLKHDKNLFISIGQPPLNLLPPEKATQESKTLNPFMPFKGEIIRQEHLQILRNSIIGSSFEAKEASKSMEIHESEGEKNNSREREKSPQPNIGLSRGISITEKYLSSDFKANEKNSHRNSDE